MTKHALAAVAAVLALAGCSVDVDTGSDDPEPTDGATVERLDEAELEELVVSGVTPDDAAAAVSADCAGEIDVEVDAAQDCQVTVGEDVSDVHFVITEVEDGEVIGADYTPYVPGDRLAGVVEEQLSQQQPDLDNVQCDEELTGEKGATTTCTATAGGGEARVEVDVTQVDGLFINFHMQLVE